MTHYYFRVQESRGGVSDLRVDLTSLDAAWTEIANVCGDLVGSATRGLKPNEAWQIELLDVTKKPLFRIRVVAEALQ